MPENLSPETGASQQPVRNKVPVWFWMLIGCGGVGFLFVIAVIIAAVAIPSVSMERQRSYEASGMGNLRAYATAQVMHYRMYSVYADQLPGLAVCNGRAGGLIDPAFAAAHGPTGVPKQGYLFQDCKTIGGKPVDRTKDFALCAKPGAYGKTGRLTFIVKTDGVVWCKDRGPGATFVDDYPADPAKAGWVEAD